MANEEWDFSGCPEDEIFDCWVYEFAREYFRRHKTVPEAYHMFFPVSADFPNTPYLCTSRVNPSEEDVKLVSEWLDKHPEVRPEPPVSIGSGKADHNLRLKIDWRYSDTRLIPWIRKILKEERPHGPVQRKGRPEFGVLETDLKCLGAFRLLKIAGLKAMEAAEYTRNVLEEELYVESTNWSEAVSRVDSLVENFASRMDEFAH